ncbi:MAG: tyrosine-type recombinase/integrase [Planctomycetota bacterium]|jgi:integrase
MRIKKTGTSKKPGKLWVIVKDHQDIERMFPAFKDERLSKELGSKIEKLINCRAAGEPPSRELNRWLEGAPPKVIEKLVKFNILESHRAAANKLLSEHLQDFKNSLLANDTEEYAGVVFVRLSKMFDACKFITWTDITADKVEVFLKGLRDGGFSVATSNYYLKSAKQFCRWMKNNRRTTESPLEFLKTLTVVQERHPRRAFTLAELKKFFAVVKVGPTRYGLTGHQRYCFYRLAAETGYRRKEIASLTGRSFDFEAETVTLAKSASKNKKGDTRYLGKDMLALVKELTKNKMPDVPIFQLKTVNGIWIKTNRMIQEDLARAGIPYIDEAGRYLDVHSLRHTYGTLLDAGFGAKNLQEAMRHSSPVLTSRYLHTTQEGKRAMVDAMPDLSPANIQVNMATGTDDLSAGLSGTDTHQSPPIHTAQNSTQSKGRKTPIKGSNTVVETGQISPAVQSDRLVTTDKTGTCENENKNLSADLSKLIQKYPDLLKIVKAWPGLPEHIKAAIKTLIEGACMSPTKQKGAMK